MGKYKSRCDYACTEFPCKCKMYYFDHEELTFLLTAFEDYLRTSWGGHGGAERLKKLNALHQRMVEMK